MASVGGYDIADCLVDTYLSQMPFDPSATGAQWTSSADYDTGYSIIQGSNGRVTVNAPAAELSEVISITR